MCFNVSVAKPADALEARFGASFGEPFAPIFHASAFSDPRLPIIKASEPKRIAQARWGLVPRWARSAAEAEKLRLSTPNARAETLFEKPAFREAANDGRCLVLVDGFFEWREVGGRKYPYHVRLKSGEAFAIAGVVDTWQGAGESAPRTAFSVITTRANPLLEFVHNTKKRMPAMLATEDERRWLAPLERGELEALLKPYDDAKMEAWPVSRLITEKGADSNVPAVRERFEYRALKGEQAKLI
jgi:putative SOS response-associated peptidase YedK